MADKFNNMESCPVEQPRPLADCLFEILGHVVIEPMKNLCSRNEGVALSVQSCSLNLKVDDSMDAAYADC